MKKICVRWTVCLAALSIALTGLSCSKDTSGKKDSAQKPPGHEKMVEQYRKGIQESKEVVVAKVNGADIRMNELISKMNEIAPRYAASPQELTPEIDKKVKGEALDVLVFRELAIQEAVRRGMKVEPGVVDQILASIKTKAGSEEAFRKNLGIKGDTEETLRKGIERNELFNMIAHKEIFGKAKTDGNREQAVEKRRQEWEKELRRNAKIESTLNVVINADARRTEKK